MIAPSDSASTPEKPCFKTSRLDRDAEARVSTLADPNVRPSPDGTADLIEPHAVGLDCVMPFYRALEWRRQLASLATNA